MSGRVVRSVGEKSAIVLEEIAERRRRSVSLHGDEAWLREISNDPAQLLRDMAGRRLLYKVGAGRYVVAPPATFALEQAAPIELLVDLRLRGQGDYYLSFLTGLIGHRLTDQHSTRVFAAIRQKSSYRRGETEIDGYRLHTTRLADSVWPHGDEIEEVRAFDRDAEFYRRATVERTLVDALARPVESGGFETVIQAWARAARAHTNWDRVAELAGRQGAAMARRVAYLLRLLGFDPVANRHFAHIGGRGASVPLDRGHSFAPPGVSYGRDRKTGVLINVPIDHLRGWTGAGALG